MHEAPHAVGGAEPRHVLLISAHDWFASALQAVLEPEGFSFARVRSARTALRDATLIDPDIVIIDEGLPDLEAPVLASALVSGCIKPSVPILVYSPNFWHEKVQAEAMRAGAWDIIKEPVRSKLIVAKLRRLLEIKRLIEITEEGSLSDLSTGLFNLAGLMRVLRIMGAVSQRQNKTLSFAVVGPTFVPKQDGNGLDAERRAAAELCSMHTRSSDVCGWVGDLDIGVVAYDADASGMTSMVRRLNRLTESGGAPSTLHPLSAGIVEFATPNSEPVPETVEGGSVRDGGGSAEGEMSAETSGEQVAERREARSPAVVTQIAGLSRFAAAQNALRQAREAGGGIRIAESV